MNKKIERIGLCILAGFCLFWLVFFSYLIAAMPDYATSVFTH